MTILTHVTVGTNDVDRSRAFFDAVLGALDIQRLPEFRSGTLLYGKGKPEFIVLTPRDGKPATHANGGTIGFQAASRAAVDAFHAAALANGGSCEGAPGPRPRGPTTYAAYVRDPDGNKFCAFSTTPE